MRAGPAKLAVSLFILVMAAAAVLTVGPVDIPAREVLQIFWESIAGDPANRAVPLEHAQIVLHIRWPRIALAMLTGAALSLTGACYQGLFRNPLADPYLLGVSSGAALGAVLAIASHKTAYLGLYAFGGGIAAMAAVAMLGTRPGGQPSSSLLLAGVAVSALGNALISYILAVNIQEAGIAFFWLMGSLANPPERLGMIALLAAAAGAAVMSHARELDILALGEENAQSLGVDVARTKAVLFASTALLVGLVVAASGCIGFVGLVVPHIARRLFGPAHGILLPGSAIWGAVFLLAADGVTRSVAILATMPVGIVTALFGSPLFIYILYRTSR